MDKSQQDSLFIPAALPYEDIDYRPFTDADAESRLLGNVTYGSFDTVVTPGGRLSRRGPLTQLRPELLTNKYIERAWPYETLPSSDGTIYRYILYSAKDTTTGLYSMYYLASTSSAPVAFTSIRDVNASRAVHQVNVLKGKAYIKAFPEGTSSEKLGTIIFDGSSGTPTYRPWGIAGPTVSLKMSGWQGFLTADITSDTATSCTVTAVTAPPATSFVMWIGTEIVNVTAKSGTGPYTLTITRGYNGSKATQHKAKDRVIYRDWTASSHKVSVPLSWQYTYCYKSITGQYSNTVAEEQNPDFNQSQTFAFADLCPKMTVEGHSDTTNIPSIVIFRTTNGGGTYYEVETISNTGAGSITYEDKHYASGASSTTYSDPYPDGKLDTTKVAPTLVSNSPPPTVNEPLVTGTDTPTLAFGKMAVFQNRHWLVVANRLYASGGEETTLGNPDESFKIGRNGTYWELQSNGVSMEATSQALYIMTSGPTYMLTGSNLESFNLQQISDATPMDTFDLGCSCAFLERVAFLARGNRVCIISGTTIDIVSECIRGIPFRSGGRQMAFLSDAERQWLCVLSPQGIPTDTLRDPNWSRLYILDWKRSVEERRDWWLPPWKCCLTAICASPMPATVTYRYTWAGDMSLCGAISQYNDSTNRAGFVYYSPDGNSSDSIIVSGAYTTYSPQFAATIGPIKNPVGNHINLHALPQLTTVLTDIRVDYKGSVTALDDYNIGMSVFFDTDNIQYLSAVTSDYTSTGTKPDRRKCNESIDEYSASYYTRIFHLYEATQDFFLHITNGTIPASYFPTVLRVAVTMGPESGEGQ